MGEWRGTFAGLKKRLERDSGVVGARGVAKTWELSQLDSLIGPANGTSWITDYTPVDWPSPVGDPGSKHPIHQSCGISPLGLPCDAREAVVESIRFDRRARNAARIANGRWTASSRGILTTCWIRFR